MSLKSRSHISADKIADPQLALALRTHAAERSTILDGLSASFEREARIRAAWLWGSFLRGEQDDLSDLDLWLLVSPGSVEGFADTLQIFCEKVGRVVASGENKHNSPEGGGYFGALIAGTHGLHHVDIYWQPVGASVVPDGPILLNRLDEPYSATDEPTISRALDTSEFEYCRLRISFVWLMLSVAAKYLARDRSSDMTLMSYPRNAFEETAALLGIQDQIGEVAWTATADPVSKVNLLRQVAVKTAIVEEACRGRGYDFAREANPCLNRYFDIAEAILTR